MGRGGLERLDRNRSHHILSQDEVNSGKTTSWPELEIDEISGLADKSELELTNQLDQLIEDCSNHLLNIEQNIHTWNDKTFLVCFIQWWWRSDQE